ncbi:hypothetical protein GQ457_03G010240 [Hibiscus cannabinus]
MSRSKSKDSAARSDDYGWRWGEVVEGSRNNVKCKFCGKILTGGITQLKEHLAAKKGNVYISHHKDNVSKFLKQTLRRPTLYHEWGNSSYESSTA